MPSFSISLEPLLACPRRYRLEKVRRELCAAPFAASELGKAVHRRIAKSLLLDAPADEGAFALPRRVTLQPGEELEELIWRAHSALAYFNARCRGWLRDKKVSCVERYILRPYPLAGETVEVSGVLDLVLEGPKGEALVDWKTGSAARSEAQLKFYLVLRHLETGSAPCHAEAISLSGGEPLCIPWSDELPAWFAAKLERMRSALEACREPVARPGRHCAYCPYAHDCEASEAPARQLLDTTSGELLSVN